MKRNTSLLIVFLLLIGCARFQKKSRCYVAEGGEDKKSVVVSILDKRELDCADFKRIRWDLVNEVTFFYNCESYSGPVITSNTIKQANLLGPADMFDNFQFNGLKSVSLNEMESSSSIDWGTECREFGLRHQEIENLNIDCNSISDVLTVLEVFGGLKTLRVATQKEVSLLEIENLMMISMKMKELKSLEIEIPIAKGSEIKLDLRESNISEFGVFNTLPSEVICSELYLNKECTILGIGGAIRFSAINVDATDSIGLMLYNVDSFDFNRFTHPEKLDLFLFAGSKTTTFYGSSKLSAKKYYCMFEMGMFTDPPIPDFLREKEYEVIPESNINFLRVLTRTKVLRDFYGFK